MHDYQSVMHKPMTMSNSESIQIHIQQAELEKFCQQLLDRSRDISRTHDTLVTLEAFISVFSRESHGSGEYQQIEASLKAITEKSRQALLKKCARDLYNALTHCNATALAAVHAPLSRNGFYDILKGVIADLSDDEIRIIMVWSANWVKEARALAEEASGYPDAYDFNQAGISIEEYQAMSDIDRVLNPF